MPIGSSASSMILDDFTTPNASSWPGWSRNSGAPYATRATAGSSEAGGAGRIALTWQAGLGVSPIGPSECGDGWWRAAPAIAGLPAWLVRSRFTMDTIAGHSDGQVITIGAATVGGSPFGSDPYVSATLWAPGTPGTFNLLLWGWDDIGFPDVGTSVDAVLEAGVEYIVELAYAFGIYSVRVWRADESRSTAIVKSQAGNYVNPAYVNLGYDAGAMYGSGSFPVAATLIQKATAQSDVGQGTVTMPAAITPGHLLVLVASGRTGGIDLSPHIGASTPRPFTTYGEMQAFLGRGFLDIAYRVATGDERPLVFNTQHANITLYEVAFHEHPADFQLRTATLQGAATTKALAAFTTPGTLQIAGFIWDEHIANQTVGAGYTQDAQFVSQGNLEPGYLSAHASSGATAQISGTPYSWAGMAIGIEGSGTSPNWDGAAGASTISFLYIEVAEYIPELGWDVYRAADPNGAMRVRIQDDEAPLPGAYERSVRVALNEPGSGAFKINRHASTAALLARGDIVKCRFPWRAQYDAAFIIEQGEFQLSSTDEQGGEELDFGGRGILAYLDRAVMWATAYELGLVTSPTWTQTWSTAFTDPTGVATLPGDTTYVYLIGRYTRKISKIRQSDRHVMAVSPARFANVAAGLSADPSDAAIFWALEAPWLEGGVANTKIYKIRASDWAILATLDLGSAVNLTDIRADSSNIWATNRATDKIEKRSKTTGALVTAYSISYLGQPQTNPAGISIKGSQLAYWFTNGSSAGATRALLATVSAPTTITGKIDTTAISSFGGDWTTEAGLDYFYMVSDVHDRVWKYQLTAPVPQGPVDGTWTFLEGSAGAILWRIITELQSDDRPQSPVPNLTYGFNGATDSGGHPWAANEGAEEFTAAVGDSALATAQRLTPFGINLRLSPQLLLRADNAATDGVDRTSPTFEGGIRFEKGVNIAPEILRRDRETELHSHLLTAGASNVYAIGVLDDLGYVREGYLSTELAAATALQGTADTELDNERIVQERIVIRVVAGDDPAAGLYRPFRDYNVGDLVRLHTGYDAHDYTELDVRLYAMTLEEGEAGDWPTIVVELGSAFLYSAPTTSAGSSSAAAIGSGVASFVALPDTIVEGIDDTGATVTRAVGRTLRAAGWTVYQERSGVVRIQIGDRATLLRLADVDADAIADDELLAWDAAESSFIPALDASLPGTLTLGALAVTGPGALSGSGAPAVSNGGTATFGSASVSWVRIGKLVVFAVTFAVTGNGTGTTTPVGVTATGMPAPLVPFGIVGERQGTGEAPILARCVAASGVLTIDRLHRVSIGTTYTDQSPLVGADLLTGATYAFAGAYISA